jgi:hypothetical protein
MIDELKQIKIFELKSFDFWNKKRFCKSLVDTPIRFFNCSKQIKDEEDMVLELHRNLELFFPKKLKEIVTKIAQFD